MMKQDKGVNIDIKKDRDDLKNDLTEQELKMLTPNERTIRDYKASHR